MTRAPHTDGFDSESVEALLGAVGIHAGTAEAELFLSDLWWAIELYRELFPDGQPRAADEVRIAFKALDDAGTRPGSMNLERVGLICYSAVARAEHRTFTKIGRLSSQLANQLRGLSPDVELVFSNRLEVESSGQLKAANVVKDLEAVRAACNHFSNKVVKRTPRAHRYDVQLLVNLVVIILLKFGSGYTGKDPLREHLHPLLEDLLWKNGRGGRGNLRHLLEDVFATCMPAAGVKRTGNKKAEFDPYSDRLWYDYSLPFLRQLRKQCRHAARWGPLLREM